MRKWMRMFLCCWMIPVIAFLAAGCSGSVTEGGTRILPPQTREAPLQGTWRIEACYASNVPGNANGSDGENRWVGKMAGFIEDTIVLGEYSWTGVNYKVKRVNTEEYFLHKNRDLIEHLGIEKKELYVITASSQGRFLYEFARIDEERVVVSIEDEFYCLKRVSDRFNPMLKDMAREKWTDSGEEYVSRRETQYSGILLGIRIPVRSDRDSEGNVLSSNTNNSISNAAGSKTGYEEYRYMTYWISCRNGEVQPVLTTSDLFLPRKDGFWKVEVRRRAGEEGAQDVILASRIAGSTYKKQWPANQNSDAAGNGERKSAILYVGNDYLCVENTEYDSQTSGDAVRKVLRTLPVDNLENTSGVKISDIAGENGSIAMDNAFSEIVNTSKNTGNDRMYEEQHEENFALFRKTGHWFFKGRINFQQNGQVPFVDFNLNLIPPPDMVAYDMLHVPWTFIKDKVPQAVDAYTSPGRDMAVVITRTGMLIYALNRDALADVPLKKLKLPEGSSVVMAEWATGNYVRSWEKAFVKNNRVTKAGG